MQPAPSSSAPLSSSGGQLAQAPRGGGGGGLMDVVGQLARSPAMQQMAGQLMGPGEAQRAGGGAASGGGEPDFGALLQQMLPVVSQARRTVPDCFT